MSAQRTVQRGLGRGLGALIPTSPSAEPSVYQEVPLASVSVNPHQPRQHFEPEALAALADSIGQIGVLQPIVVRKADETDRYEIVAGERRWRASQMAGLASIPVVVREADDESSLTNALIENVHREQLNPLEEAAAFRQLLDDFGLTHDEVGRRMGRSRAAVTNSIRLLSLPTTVQMHLLDGTLAAGHARALLGCDDPEDLEALAAQAVEEGWSVRATEEAVRALRETDEPETQTGKRRRIAAERESRRADLPASVLETEAALEEALVTSVTIGFSRSGGKGGEIVIRFADLEDLGRLYRAIALRPQLEA